MTAAAKKAPARELLSLRAFGAALGVSRQAVQQALKAGRLTPAAAERDDRGEWKVDLEKGRAEWEAWTDPSKRRGKSQGRPPSSTKNTPSMFESGATAEQAQQRMTHALASTRRVDLDAQLKELELEQLRGNLVDKREIQREAFRLGRLLRDRLQSIPDRVSAQAAALDKAAQVHELLSGEIARALEALEGLPDEEGAA